MLIVCRIHCFHLYRKLQLFMTMAHNMLYTVDNTLQFMELARNIFCYRVDSELQYMVTAHNVHRSSISIAIHTVSSDLLSSVYSISLSKYLLLFFFLLFFFLFFLSFINHHSLLIHYINHVQLQDLMCE